MKSAEAWKPIEARSFDGATLIFKEYEKNILVTNCLYFLINRNIKILFNIKSLNNIGHDAPLDLGEFELS